MWESKIRAAHEQVELSLVRVIESHERAVGFYERIGRTGKAERERAAAEHARAILQQWRSKVYASRAF